MIVPRAELRAPRAFLNSVEFPAEFKRLILLRCLRGPSEATPEAPRAFLSAVEIQAEFKGLNLADLKSYKS